MANDKARRPRRRLVLLIALGLLGVLCLCFSPTALLEFRLWQARRALAERDARQALCLLEAAERLDANCSEVFFLMARAHRRLGEYGKVESALSRALRLGHSVERLKREELLSLAQNGQLAKAEPQLPKLLIDAGSDGPEICEAYVRGYLDAFRIDSAFELLDGWQADYPDDPQPHYFRGLYWEHQKAWSEAADAFRRVLQLAPRLDDLRLHLARVLKEQHQYRQAEEHYRVCLEERPNEPRALAGWGECLKDRGEIERAREKFAQLLAGSPDHFDGRLAMGEIELAAGRPREAVRWLEPAADEKPYVFRVRYALAQALSQSGKPARAREHFKFAAAAEEAKFRVEALTRRVADEPHNVKYRHEIGTKLLKYGEPSAGVVWLRSVLEFEPGHRPTHAALAEYYREQGDETLAARHGRLARAAARPSGEATP